MTPLAKLITVLLALRPYYGDGEKPEDRRERITRVAIAIEAARDPEWKGDAVEPIAALVTLGFFESGFARHVHENKCNLKIGECDNGRARSPWQFQRTPLTRKAWWDYRGSDQVSTSSAAQVVLQVMVRARNGCGSWEGAFASYATGKGCQWKGAAGRAEHFRRIVGELKKR